MHGTSLLAPAVLKDYGDTFSANILLGWGFLAGAGLIAGSMYLAAR
jgi:hypothetical protein